MKLFALLAVSAGLFPASGCQHMEGHTAAGEPARDGVFIHVTSGPEDPHRVLMAFKMAEMMSQSRDVAMYFDIQGVHVLLKDAPELTYGAFPSSLEQIEKLAGKGVPLMACPGCMQAAGKKAEDLREGTRLADKDTFFQFTEGRILTLDY